MPEIVHELSIRAPVKTVYQALTQRRGIENWWTRDVDTEPLLGSIAAFGFDNPEHLVRMRIERLEEPRLVLWRCVSGPVEWAHTEVCFTLREEPEGTVVRFQHLKWKSIEGGPAARQLRLGRFPSQPQVLSGTGRGHAVPARSRMTPDGTPRIRP